MSKKYWIEKKADGDVLCVALSKLSDEAKLRCGLDFNPSGSEDITIAKALCVGPMDLAIALVDDKRAGKLCFGAAVAASNELEKAQMLLVKSVVHLPKGV